MYCCVMRMQQGLQSSVNGLSVVVTMSQYAIVGLRLWQFYAHRCVHIVQLPTSAT